MVFCWWQVIRPIWHLLKATGLQFQALLLKLGLRRFWVGKNNVGFLRLVGYVGWLVGGCTGGWLKLLIFFGEVWWWGKWRWERWWLMDGEGDEFLLTKIPNEMWMDVHLSHVFRPIRFSHPVFGNQPTAVDQPTYLRGRFSTTNWRLKSFEIQ